MIAVTTFPVWAWDVYAKRSIESFLRFWPIPILIYAESPPPLSSDRVGVEPLNEIEEWRDFISYEGPPPPKEIYLWDAKRFCHKVFSQIDALKDHERVIWLDADVITRKTVPREVIDFITEDFITFLGRDTYTETGLIGFNSSRPGFEDFIENYRALYVDKDIYKLNFWTDCHAFDFARKGLGHNLTPNGRGVEDVFSKSIMGEYCTHLKGNRKFAEELRAV